MKIWFQNRRSKYKKLYKAAQNGQLPGVDAADIAADLGANLGHMGPESPHSPAGTDCGNEQPPSSVGPEAPLSPPPERPQSHTPAHEPHRDMMISPPAVVPKEFQLAPPAAAVPPPHVGAPQDQRGAPMQMPPMMAPHPQWDPAHYMSYWNHYGDVAAQHMNHQIMT